MLKRLLKVRFLANWPKRTSLKEPGNGTHGAGPRPRALADRRDPVVKPQRGCKAVEWCPAAAEISGAR